MVRLVCAASDRSHIGVYSARQAFTPVVSARPKYSKRYVLLASAGTIVVVVALAAIAMQGASNELMQGSDEVSVQLILH